MSQRQPSGWAVGWTYFAAFMMIMIGGFHAIAGLVAIIDDAFYTTPAEYVFQFDASTWGWIHLILGTVVLVAGFGLFTGAAWARVVGVILALISALVAFAWIPWYPIWSICLVAVSIAVIWALTAHGHDVTEM
ncbi:MAG: DUF7144 family membrane protein [Actinomycetota bacterium]